MAGRGERWDRDRLVVDRDREQERGRFVEDDRYYMSGGRGRDHSDERHDRSYGRSVDDEMIRDRRYYEENARFDPRDEPRREPFDRRVVVEKEREREYHRDASPGRPTLLRRQSSLDTHDRRPLHRFYDREEYPPPALREDIRREDIRRDVHRAPPYTPIPLPKARGLPPPRRYDDRLYEDIHVAELDRYEDDYPLYPERIVEREFVKEKEKERRDVSRDSRSTRTRSRRARSPSSKASRRSDSSSSVSGGTTVRSEYPKKGKTRIPARLVSTRALIDVGYPFVEEGNVIVVQKALGQENIDELLKLSEEYKKCELEVAAARSSAGSIVEERREVIIEAPAPPTTIVVPAPPPPEVIIDAAPRNLEVVDKTLVRELSPSRSSSEWNHHHHRHSGEYEIVERHRSRSRSKKDIRAEIRALERELSHRPRREYTEREVIRTERLPDGQLVVYEEQVERSVPAHKPPRIEKDKKGRMSISVPKYR